MKLKKMPRSQMCCDQELQIAVDVTMYSTIGLNYETIQHYPDSSSDVYGAVRCFCGSCGTFYQLPEYIEDDAIAKAKGAI